MASEKAAVEQTVAALEPYEDAVLLAGLKEVLEQRPSVVQELCDWAVPDYAYPSSRMLTESRLSGVIKTFSENNGYGFIESPEVKAAFGNDVFLHYRQLNGHSIGDQVTFTILVNKERKPQAFDLDPPKGGGWGGGSWGKGFAQPKGGPGKLAAAQTKGGGKGQLRPVGMQQPGAWPADCFNAAVAKGKGKGQSKGKVAWSPPEGSMELPGVTDARFDGQIKSFNEAKGFGFVSCDAIQLQFGCDVFLHHLQFAGFEVGQAVSFGVLLNKAGKPQAKELAPLLPSGGIQEPAAKKARWGL